MKYFSSYFLIIKTAVIVTAFSLLAFVALAPYTYAQTTGEQPPVQSGVLGGQSISLAPGWNIVSTPKVLESHEFSAENKSENFDIYLLDPSKQSGWATMADLGQTEFTPLYGYFVNNKTDEGQTLTFVYDTNLSPNEQLFTRTFNNEGWYSIGVANGEYAKAQDGNTIDINNPSRVLSLLQGTYDTVIDFTDGDYDTNPLSVALSDTWKGVVPEDINSLNDLRETKGYAVYLRESGVAYNGFQNSAGSTGEGDVPEFMVNISSVSTVDRVTGGTPFFEFDIQPTDEDIVLGTLVVKVSTPGATTSDIIDPDFRSTLLQDNGESALYAYDYDQREVILAGQKKGFSCLFP